MALAHVRSIIRSWNIVFLEPIVENVMNMAFQITNEAVVDRRTPRQLLEGRNITLLGLIDMIIKPLKQLGVPIELKFGRFGVSSSAFGFILMRSGGPFGPFEMYTGQNGKPGLNHYSSVYGKRWVDAISRPQLTLAPDFGFLEA